MRVVTPGSYVVCAVTGAHIPLDALRYWSVDLQEAYASPAIATARAQEKGLAPRWPDAAPAFLGVSLSVAVCAARAMASADKPVRFSVTGAMDARQPGAGQRAARLAWWRWTDGRCG